MPRPKGSKNKKRKPIMADATPQEPATTPEAQTKPEEEATATPQEPSKKKSSGVTVAIDEESARVDSYGGDCINCGNHGKRTELNANGSCPKCGFDKSKLYGAF